MREGNTLLKCPSYTKSPKFPKKAQEAYKRHPTIGGRGAGASALSPKNISKIKFSYVNQKSLICMQGVTMPNKPNEFYASRLSSKRPGLASSIVQDLVQHIVFEQQRKLENELSMLMSQGKVIRCIEYDGSDIATYRIVVDE